MGYQEMEDRFDEAENTLEDILTDFSANGNAWLEEGLEFCDGDIELELELERALDGISDAIDTFNKLSIYYSEREEDGE